MSRGTGLLALTLALGALGVLGSGCQLERRGEAGEGVLAGVEGDSLGGADALAADSLGGVPPDPMRNALPDSLRVPSVPGDPDASVRLLLDVFRESVRVGDLSLALDLLHPQAVLMDDLVAEGDAASPPTRGEHLLALRRRHAGGLGFQTLDSQLRWVGDAALLRTRLLLTEPDPDAESGSVVMGWARESTLLVPTPEGWRILHLHRSMGPGNPPEPTPESTPSG